MESYQIQNLLEMLIVTGGSLVALWMVSRAWIQRRGTLGKGEVERIHVTLDQVKEGLARLHDEMVEITERLEFAERLLSRAVEGNEQKPLPRH